MRLVLAVACCTACARGSEQPRQQASSVLRLEHRPHAVSASRWGEHAGNASIEYRRREEALAVQEELEYDWRRQRRLGGGGSVPVLDPASTTPLFEGIGTHYAHVFVGTPPQRVSVIIDTGSHHTAFPCSGCSNCGTHTDPYYDPKKSSTNRVLACEECKGGSKCSSKSGGKCEFSQSYTEGSSWKAHQMEDQFWVGGQFVASEPAKTQGSPLSVPFLFGCQISETGLFRTQKADGIMGLSANSMTLVPMLQGQHKIASKTFGLCFMKGGGLMMLGGADRRAEKEPMTFVPLSKQSTWFTLRLLDIRMSHEDGAPAKGGSIGAKENAYNTGKGVIVDSGTTDTYLPRQIANEFKAKFKRATKRDYGNVKMTLADQDVEKFPTIYFIFKDSEGQEVPVAMKPSAYLEHQGANRYVPRIYLTEGSGAVLGANFMQDHSVLFDQENGRVGFAKADCNYDHLLVKGGGGGTALPPTPPETSALPEGAAAVAVGSNSGGSVGGVASSGGGGGVSPSAPAPASPVASFASPLTYPSESTPVALMSGSENSGLFSSVKLRPEQKQRQRQFQAHAQHGGDSGVSPSAPAPSPPVASFASPLTYPSESTPTAPMGSSESTGLFSSIYLWPEQKQRQRQKQKRHKQRQQQKQQQLYEQGQQASSLDESSEEQRATASTPPTHGGFLKPRTLPAPPAAAAAAAFTILIIFIMIMAAVAAAFPPRFRSFLEAARKGSGMWV